MEEKKKKKKLTLTASPKVSINAPHYTRGRKTSVVIEKKISRKNNERRFFNRNENQARPKSNFTDKQKPYTKPFEKSTGPNRSFEMASLTTPSRFIDIF